MWSLTYKALHISSLSFIFSAEVIEMCLDWWYSDCVQSGKWIWFAASAHQKWGEPVSMLLSSVMHSH